MTDKKMELHLSQVPEDEFPHTADNLAEARGYFDPSDYDPNALEPLEDLAKRKGCRITAHRVILVYDSVVYEFSEKEVRPFLAELPDREDK